MRLRQAVMTLACVLALVAVPVAAFAQRGEARISGKVVDEQGKPLQDVVIKATLPGQPPLQAKTNRNGEFSINNMAGGMYEVELTKEGFAPQKSTLDLKPDQNITGIEVKMAKPKADPNVEIQAEAKKAQEFLQNKQYVEGRKIYETLLVKYPDLHQLHEFIGRTYAAEGNYDEAIKHVRMAVEKDTANIQGQVFLGDLLMEKGDKAEAQKIFDAIDLSKVDDPSPFINLAITKINDQKPDEALALIDKLVARFPKETSLLYYRGRANLSAKKMPEAKADLEKFVASALPDARELPDAKKILEQMKDVK